MGMILVKKFFQPSLLDDSLTDKIFSNPTLLRFLKRQNSIQLPTSQQALANGSRPKRFAIRGLKDRDDVFGGEPTKPATYVTQARTIATLPNQGLDNGMPANKAGVIKKMSKEKWSIRQLTGKQITLGPLVGGAMA